MAGECIKIRIFETYKLIRCSGPTPCTILSLRPTEVLEVRTPVILN